MYENMTSDRIENRMLARIPETLDKREGSIIYDATAPAAIELAEAYIMARVILRQTFATTADRPYLILRAMEYNMAPYDASAAEVKAVFSQAISLGTRFSSEQSGLNYVVSDVIDDALHTYKMTCETAGAAGNDCIGAIVPIETISGLSSAEITEIITPGEDAEETETFRARFIAALKSKAYGGNGDDYKEKVLAIAGIGGVKVYRCWAGGGTVKTVILASDYSIPGSERVAEVQEMLDPEPQGKGYGIAPIGHTVTVAAATSLPINITATVFLASGVTVADMQAKIEEVLADYLATLRKTWCNQNDREFLTVRAAIVLSEILGVKNVEDVTNVTINGASDRIQLETDEVPVLGTVTLTQGA